MSTSDKSVAELFSETPEPRDTRERILYASLELFRGQGFHAVGLDRILAAVGVTKTTFYNHFESRDALIVEAIRLRDSWDASAFSRKLHEKAGYAPRDLLLAMFDVLDEWFTHPDFRGCLFLHACAEFPSRDHPVHRAAADHFAVSRRTVASMAEAAGIADSEAFADSWCLLLNGAVSYRTTSGDDQAARIAKRLAVHLLDEQAPAG